MEVFETSDLGRDLVVGRLVVDLRSMKSQAADDVVIDWHGEDVVVLTETVTVKE